MYRLILKLKHWQLFFLLIVYLIVLIFFIVLINGCSNQDNKLKGKNGQWLSDGKIKVCSNLMYLKTDKKSSRPVMQIQIMNIQKEEKYIKFLRTKFYGTDTEYNWPIVFNPNSHKDYIIKGYGGKLTRREIKELESEITYEKYSLNFQDTCLAYIYPTYSVFPPKLKIWVCFNDETESGPYIVNIYSNQTNKFTDTRDGKKYKTVKIYKQWWMSENLDVSTYRNGDIIPHIQDREEWADLTTGAWCYYENNAERGENYGKLYNWYAVNDPRGLAPKGWHIPSDDEWQVLIEYLGGSYGAAKRMGDEISNLWPSKNESGFTAIQSGGCNEEGYYTTSSYVHFWSSTELSNKYQTARYYSLRAGIEISDYTADKRSGMCVRCVKD